MLVLVLFLCCIILSVELVTMVFSERKNTLLPMAEEVYKESLAACRKDKAIKVAMYKFLSIMKNWGPLPANQGAVKLQK